MAAFSGKTWVEWLVYTNDIEKLWKAQPSYLASQAVYMLMGFITLIHAFRKGGRWPWFWLATVLHGLYADNFWHFVVPEYDNFWHSQTPVIFLGARTPLHIIFLYPAFLYNAAYAISKLNLPAYAEPFAVGLTTVLIDIPYDIVAVKFVHWTWHDTDPNIMDRFYWVPWNSFYFHATFAAALVFLFHVSRRWFAPKADKWQKAGKDAEVKSLLFTVLFAMPLGVLAFVPIYHTLHDMYGVHTEVTFFALFTVFAVVVVLGLLSDREKSKDRLTAIDYILIAQLVVHFVLYWALVVWGYPEREWATGLHQPVGPCDQIATITTPLGQTLQKQKYLCVEKYDEGYFDFHCIKNHKLANGTTWYTVCGTPFQNRVEYITVLSTILVLASGVFYGLFFKTAANNATPRKMKKQ